MKHISIGGLDVSRIGLGCMSMSGYYNIGAGSDAESIGKTLAKSLRVLKGGGKLISISGPPDPEFGQESRAPGFVKLVMWLLSAGIRRKAKSRGVSFSFLFMKANGSQLRETTRLFDAGLVRPVMDRVFPFESTNEAMAYVETGRAKGKVVVKIR